MSAPVVAQRTAGLLRRLWRGRDVAVVYCGILAATAVVLAALPAATAHRWVLECSTNLDNLRQHPPLVLVVSAFVQPAPVELAIVPLLVWVYGAVQRWLGRAAAIVTAILGHVGATLFVATILAAGIAKGRITDSTAHVADVGASYGLLAAAGLLVARVPHRWLPAYLTVLSGLLTAGLVFSRTFTDLGHVVAWCIGLGLALLVTRARQATGGRLPDATGAAARWWVTSGRTVPATALDAGLPAADSESPRGTDSATAATSPHDVTGSMTLAQVLVAFPTLSAAEVCEQFGAPVDTPTSTQLKSLAKGGNGFDITDLRAWLETRQGTS